MLLLLPAAGSITCNMTAHNSGTVSLTDVILTRPGGPCATIATLAPGSDGPTCELTLAVMQLDFDTQEASTSSTLGMDVIATGTSNVATSPLTVANPAAQFTGLRLQMNRALTATSSVSRTEVDAVGEASARCVHDSCTWSAWIYPI
jgi:hypothetical protein